MDYIQNPYSFDAINPDDLKPDVHGRVKVKAKIMKVGKLKYVTPEGKEYFGEITLDNLKKALPTANLKSVTVRHPPKLLDERDVKQYEEGISADSAKIEEIDGETWLTNGVILQTDKAINTAKEGKFGVSAGYFRNAIPKTGNVLDFSDIDINHIAIGCLNPRAEGAEIYSLDEADDSGRIETVKQQNPKKEVAMKERTLNAVQVGAWSMDEALITFDESSDGAIKTFANRETKFKSRLTELQESMDSMEADNKAKISELTGELKGLQAKVKDYEEKEKNMISMDDLSEKVKELATVKEIASNHGIEEDFATPFDGKKLIVEKVYPEASFDDEEIEGAYKTIKADPAYSKEKTKSDQALKQSMDSKAWGRVPLSKVDPKDLLKKSKDRR